MFVYDSLSCCPNAFRSLTGMNPAEFESLLIDFAAAQYDWAVAGGVHERKK